jgi:sRNA-binding carbon storage regulator CsrA
MLVLTRRASADSLRTVTGGEDEIVLRCPGGERIVVKVLPTGMRRGAIRIGIVAPPAVTILRGELEKAQDLDPLDEELALYDP